MINLNDNFQNNTNKSIDAKYAKLALGVVTPYVSVSEANSAIPMPYRHKGLTVLVTINSENREFWYKEGVTDAHLVLKSNDPVVSTVSVNTTAVGGYIYHVDTTSSDVTITIDPADLWDSTTNTTKFVLIKKISSDVNDVWIVPSSGTIEGTAGTDFNTQYAKLSFYSDGTNLFYFAD